MIKGLLILLLACIGNAEWWVILVNRWHSTRRRHSRLRLSRRLHDVGVLLFPPFIFVAAGLGTNGLLNGGHISDLSTPVRYLLYITLAGLVPFFWSVLRWQLQRPSQRLLFSESVRFNVLEELKHSTVYPPAKSLSAAVATTSEVELTPAEKRFHSSNDVTSDRPPQDWFSVRGHRRSLLARFPGNEIYHLEVTRKCLRIGPGSSDPQCPVRRMKVAHFSDVHMLGCPGRTFYDFATSKLCELKPDLFLFTGDLLDDEAMLPCAVEMFQELADVAPGFFILGNHDWHLDDSRIRRDLCGTGWIDISGTHQTIEAAGQKILIAGSEAPWMGDNPQVPVRGDEDVRILLSHAPDQRNYAVQADFDLMLSGHNHGGQVVLPVIGPVYSPSRFGVRYAGGTYHHRSLTMHVSRGLAAKDCLRWNCSPEVSLLHLEICRPENSCSGTA